MSSIVTQDFFGRPVAFHQMKDGADLWTTADEASRLLGLSGRQAVAKLFRQHKNELIDGAEFAYVKLAPVGCENGSAPDARVKTTLIFSTSGLEMLAILTRSEAGAKLRRWVINLRASLRAKERVIVDPQRLMEQLAEAHRQHVETLKDFNARSLAETKSLRSMLGRLLGQTGIQKRREARLTAEIEEGQKFIPFNGVSRLPKPEN